MKAFIFAVLVCAIAAPVGAEGLQPLDDGGLSEVSAQQGIAFDLEYRINAKADGEPVPSAECPNVGVLTGGSSCRIAYAFPDLGGWLVLKGYRGLIKLTNVRIDAATTPSTYTIRTDGPDAGTVGGDAGYLNPYMAETGYIPTSKPALQLTAGNWADAGCAGTPGAACYTYLNRPNYTDLTASMNIEKITAEFDTSATVKDGYLKNNVTGAALAVRLAHGVGLVPDPNNPPDVMIGPYSNTPAQIRLDGRMQLFGFGY